MIRFADDFVVVVKGTRAQAKAVLAELPEILARVGLTLSPAETRLTHMDDGFEFLGFALRRKHRANGKPYMITLVSDEALGPRPRL